MVSAPVQSIDGPFVPASADQPLDVGLHQQLQDALGHSTQKVTVASLLQKLIQWQSLLGHRGLSAQCEVEQLHPRPPAAVTTPAPPPGSARFSTANSAGNYTTSVDATYENGGGWAGPRRPPILKPIAEAIGASKFFASSPTTEWKPLRRSMSGYTQV